MKLCYALASQKVLGLKRKGKVKNRNVEGLIIKNANMDELWKQLCQHPAVKVNVTFPFFIFFS